ncbi:MAG: leucyl aminopeptidase family protein, partial [Rhodobacteraceae bacterium]|nr:leucyl aminopeptidase family protein [Paracoccaceae bacterium]
MSLRFAAPSDDACPLDVVAEDGFDEWFAALPAQSQDWVKTIGFTAALGQAVMVPSGDGTARAVIGFGSAAKRARGRFALASGFSKLPQGVYELIGDLPAGDLGTEALG